MRGRHQAGFEKPNLNVIAKAAADRWFPAVSSTTAVGNSMAAGEVVKELSRFWDLHEAGGGPVLPEEADLAALADLLFLTAGGYVKHPDAPRITTRNLGAWSSAVVRRNTTPMMVLKYLD